MTTSERLPRPVEVGRSQGCRKGSILADWLSSTDHKIIGHRYLITSSGFFLAGGIMAMIMRAQLMGPGQPHRVGLPFAFLDPDVYPVTIHPPG